jgi:hypothetical protein
MNAKKTKTLQAIFQRAKTPYPPFYDVMVSRLSKKKADKIENTIRQLLKNRDGHGGDIWNADYANAFGIMQGVAYALGYTSAAITTREDQPGYWFDQILKECPCKLSNRD